MAEFIDIIKNEDDELVYYLDIINKNDGLPLDDLAESFSGSNSRKTNVITRNQLLDADHIEGAFGGGISWDKTGVNEFTTHGTATARKYLNFLDTRNTKPNVQVLKDHIYYLSGCPAGGSTASYDLAIYVGGVLSITDIGSGAIAKASSNGLITVYAVIQAGIDVDGFVWRPSIVDLTVTFGAGNEPTSVTDARLASLYEDSTSGSFWEFIATDEDWGDLYKTDLNPIVATDGDYPSFSDVVSYLNGLDQTIDVETETYEYDEDGFLVEENDYEQGDPDADPIPSSEVADGDVTEDISTEDQGTEDTGEEEPEYDSSDEAADPESTEEMSSDIFYDTEDTDADLIPEGGE